MTIETDESRRIPDGFVLAGLMLGTFAIAAIGGWVTAPNIASWYDQLAKPSFNPPDWLFGPVWWLLYLLMSIGTWLAWRSAPERDRRPLLILYAVQLAINLLWSILFFGLHLPVLAFADCLLLLAATVTLMIFCGRFNSPAAWLLLPYPLWVAFASVLNGAIVLLN
jgi:tryptophan-rich sensory protein